MAPSFSPLAVIRASTVAAAAAIAFLACLPNPRLWDDRFIFETRLAPGAVTGLGQIWQEPYWGKASGDVFRPLALSEITHITHHHTTSFYY